ncbi:DsbA family oxidoreductase [Hoeflea sp. AS16]|uniref:DsbA family oxidoreductase n=1 Tax=Hoeflea sp. AS16 TaxID=3135779 RepID=UPI003172DA7F
MTQTHQPLRIDIISDVVCPWCIVGYSQLKQALDATGTAHEIHWHPFELNPEMPAEGQNLGEHIAEKYGSTREQSLENRERLAKLGAGLGFEFNFTDDMRMYNTFNTHQLIHWADTQNLGHELKQAMFAAYFTEQRDLSDIDVLADIASKVGLDATEAKAVLEDQRYAEDVRKLESFWVQQGIRGVPAIVFEGKHLVTGAQGTENYTSILKQLTGAGADA